MGKRCFRLIVLLSLLAVISSCAPQAAQPLTPQVPAPAAAAVPAQQPAPAAPAKPAWQEQWERTLAAAKKDGRVVITTVLGSAGRTAIMEGFKKAYGIPVEAISGRGVQLAEKVLSERRAGLYSYDIYISGSTTALNFLKPAGAFDPLEPSLILPDVTDPELIKKVWWQEKLWWVDADHTHLAPSLRLNLSVAINTNLVKEGEIKSYRDLLNPKWQDKLVLNDPTTTGSGPNFVMFADAVLGWDYLVELAKAKPVILRDSRQMMEWLAHGKVAIVAAPTPDMLTEFIQVRAPIKGLIPAEGTWLVGGSSNISIYNRPPHPNADKIFINWYLSKEGQTIVAPAAGSQSARRDVPTGHLSPEQLRQSGVKYFIAEDEKLTLAQPAQMNKAKELFGLLMK